MEAKIDSEYGKMLVELVNIYVSITNEMVDLIWKTFAGSSENSKEVQQFAHRMKKYGKEMIDSVSSYTEAVNIAFGEVK